ncbi:MAG: alpha-mannosidase, partial [Clostridia bacterium]|nr:alpha-mannosidase [Clostridia bacterium]
MRNNLESLGHDRNELQQRVEALLKELKGRLRKPAGNIENLSYKPCDYKSGTKIPVPDGTFSPFPPDGRWGGKRDSHAWFLFDADVPDPGEGARTELRVKTDRRGWDASNPQFILYIDGRTVQGMDVNHETAVLNDPGRHSFALYAYTGTDVDGLLSLYISLEEVDEELEGLYFDLLVPLRTADQTDCRSPEYAAILKELNGAINLLDTRDIYSPAFYESVRAARARLKKFYSSLPASAPGRVACIGHTHIDVAWKWTVRQTVEKAQRSFATALALLDRYPEYRFTSSQAVLYRFVKEEDPGLWERVKARVREGRFEPEGAMWVEADCNLPSGESLVRQIVYGKRFFREEFSKECRVLWLPDVFGYSAALPQIMKKSGITKFVTSKISWNDQNTMPFDSFLWRGIDGTEIFTHFITSQKLSEGFERRSTYVAQGTPSMIAGTYARYQQKYYNGEVTSTVGFGDGGGGTTPDDIENIRRMKKALPGMPTAAFENLGEHLARVEKNARAAGPLPLWSGELYLEYHRGTYTSQANNKKNNRKCEYLLQNAETLGVAAALTSGSKPDPRELRREWEMLLLDQFHDIIPGSSIGAVYEDSARDYAAIKDKCEKLVRRSLSAIAARVKKAGVLVWNPTPH